MNDKQAIEFFNSLVEEFGEAIPECKLIIDDKPLRKGVWGFYRQSTNSIHINRMAMELVGDDYKMVIIHEYAHHIHNFFYPKAKQQHSPEFKRIDKMMGGLGLTNISFGDKAKQFLELSSERKVKTHLYHCGCSEHEITTHRHNKIIKGSVYRCTKCKSPIVSIAIIDGIVKKMGLSK